jgi:hypothetical protein
MRSIALFLGLMVGGGLSDPITRMQVPVFAKVTRIDLPPSEGVCNELAARIEDGILSSKLMISSENEREVWSVSSCVYYQCDDVCGS